MRAYIRMFFANPLHWAVSILRALFLVFLFLEFIVLVSVLVTNKFDM